MLATSTSCVSNSMASAVTDLHHSFTDPGDRTGWFTTEGSGAISRSDKTGTVPTVLSRRPMVYRDGDATAAQTNLQVRRD